MKSIETSLSGDWFARVEYHDKRQPKNGTRLYRSHLLAVDLNRFEIVTEEEIAAAAEKAAKASQPPAKRPQLALPFADGADGEDYIRDFTTSSYRSDND